MNRHARWMTQDFVFTAPVAFSHVVALEPERFRLWPAAETAESPSLFVTVLEAQGTLDLDRQFASIAENVLELSNPADWSVYPKQLFGRDARQGAADLPTEGAREVVEVVLVRGVGERSWVFARRSTDADEGIAVHGFAGLLQSLQASASSAEAGILRSQFMGHEKRRLGLAKVGQRSERVLPTPSDTAWERRLATTVGADEVAAVTPMIADAVALVEEPYGDPVPVGASRIGGGPDLPIGVWPTNARGMRHPFLMQIDLAEVASACGPMPPLPEAGLLSFFVHGDDLRVDVVYSPPGAPLVSFPMTRDIIESSCEAIRLVGKLPDDVGPGPLPLGEGDHVAALVQDDGSLVFRHSADPVWAYGTPGETFNALSDERWACVASARLRPMRTRSINFAKAQMRIEEEGVGSESDLEDICEDLRWAPVGMRPDTELPQIHQILGCASFEGRQDCREEMAGSAERNGYADLTAPESWMVLARVNANSTTGREFWDALDLTVMAPEADVDALRWDRCILLLG